MNAVLVKIKAIATHPVSTHTAAAVAPLLATLAAAAAAHYPVVSVVLGAVCPK